MSELNLMKTLLRKWGADTSLINESWCWKEFFSNYSDYCEDLKSHLLRNPDSEIIYYLVKYSNNVDIEFLNKIYKFRLNLHWVYRLACDFEWTREWAEKVIEENKLGVDVSYFVYSMFVNCNSSTKWIEKVIFNTRSPCQIAFQIARKDEEKIEWAKKIIKKRKSSYWAYILLDFFGKGKVDQKWVEEIIEKNKDAEGAYKMFCNFDVDKDWVERILKKSKHIEHAFVMVKYFNYPNEWVEKIIEKEGSVEYACRMVREFGSSKEWLKKVIAKTKRSQYIYLVAEGYGIEKEWIEEIIYKNNDAESAYQMVLNYNSDYRWAEKIIEENKNSNLAYLMVRNCGSDRMWAERIIEKNIEEIEIIDGYKSALLYELLIACLMVEFCGSLNEWRKSLEKNCC